MHSWVFRHRARLRVIFGVADGADEQAEASERRPARRMKPTHKPQRRPRGEPGTIQRRARDVVMLQPMRRPDGPALD